VTPEFVRRRKGTGGSSNKQALEVSGVRGLVRCGLLIQTDVINLKIARPESSNLEICKTNNDCNITSARQDRQVDSPT